ncbi:cation-translocating P-type ATPase [Patescibacteria group bacterium]|nr:cation-translocating P-type ATPase [Patescibacteria group bacterium]
MRKMLGYLKNPKVATSSVSWLVFLITLLLGLSGVRQTTLIPLYVLGILIGGFYFVWEAIEKLVKKKIGIELLMSVGIVGAAALGEWREALLLVGLYSISEAIESFITDKTRSAIEALMDLVPKHALVKRDGKTETVLAEKLMVGDVFIVKAGESIATDGVIRKGSGSINQAAITGESIPVFKKEGEQVFAGTINEDGLIEIEATKVFKENTISKIIKMVEEAQDSKGKRQQMVEKFSHTFSPIVLGISILMPPILLFLGFSLSDALARAITFVVAAAPCAFAVSVPVAFAAALGTSARKGVLVKGGIHLEELAEIKMIAFDKTGTLTTGKPVVTDILPFDSLSQKNFLQIAGGLAINSSHPLSRAIQAEIQKEKIETSPSINFHTMAGEGVRGNIDGETYFLGSPKLVEGMGHDLSHISEFTKLSSEGKTVVFVSTQKKILGLIAIADAPREKAKAALAQLHQLGVQNVMLTGDYRLVGESIGKTLGVDTVLAELKPDQKVEKIKELKQKYQHVGMVGDGINDAPALAESSVGMAMGSAGTDAALEAADVAIMGDDLERIPDAIARARYTKKVVFQNIIFSTILQVSVMFLAIFMLLSVSQILFIDEFGEVLVVLNGLRLLNGKVKKVLLT